MLEELETIIGATQVEHALALMTCSKQCVTDSEMIDLLAFDEEFQSNTTYSEWLYRVSTNLAIWNTLKKGSDSNEIQLMSLT